VNGLLFTSPYQGKPHCEQDEQLFFNSTAKRIHTVSRVNVFVF
jgi:hypothetical protein